METTFRRSRGLRSRMGIVLALAVAAAAPARSQSVQPDRGSRIIPIGHWSYEYVQRLRSRGFLTGLNPLIQPYRRADVARGLSALDPATLAVPTSRWVRMLREEFERELDRLAGREVREWGFLAGANLTGSSSRRRDPLRPLGEEDVWPGVIQAAWVETGALVAHARLNLEEYLEDDPDGPIDQGRAGRTDNAYLSVSFPVGDLWFGRLKQNWSALGSVGKMISSMPSAYPQLSFELRVGKFSLRSMTGELDELTDFTGTPRKRYISAHRVDFRMDNLVLSVGEATLFAATTGFQFRFLNPLEGNLVEATNAKTEIAFDNVMIDVEFWHGRRGVEFYGEFVVDDVDVSPEDPDPAPFRYAFHFGSRFTSLARWLELGIDYQQVSGFAYRTVRVADSWSHLRRGLGENFSDFDRLTLTADLFTPVGGLRLSPTVQLQRRGEGDLRDPLPPRAEFRASPAIFLGVKETTIRLGLRGRYQPNRYLWVTWDLGENFVRSARHVPGVNISEFEVTAAVGVELNIPFSRGP